MTCPKCGEVEGIYLKVFLSPNESGYVNLDEIEPDSEALCDRCGAHFDFSLIEGRKITLLLEITEEVNAS